MKDKKYKAKGYITFAYSPTGIIYQKISKEDIIAKRTKHLGQYEKAFRKAIQEDIENGLTYPIYHLMDGKEFLENVKDGDFIDYDGTLSSIFVDGYKSNLGLVCEGIMQGEFLLDGDAFEEFCNKHTVEVNWANK